MAKPGSISRKRNLKASATRRLWLKLRGPLARSRLFAELVSMLLVAYLRLVHRTNKLVHDDKARADDIFTNKVPFIVTCWHGQHFLVPFFGRNGHPSAIMVSRSNDAELNARVIQRLGFDTVRASGGRVRAAAHSKGAVKGLLALRNHLRAGRSVSMIADIPHGTPRVAGMGIINLARMTGAPIVPVAYASSRRRVLQKTWDKTVLNFPFGKAAFCIGDLIEVPADADDEQMEDSRIALQSTLNKAMVDAYTFADGGR